MQLVVIDCDGVLKLVKTEETVSIGAVIKGKALGGTLQSYSGRALRLIKQCTFGVRE